MARNPFFLAILAFLLCGCGGGGEGGSPSNQTPTIETPIQLDSSNAVASMQTTISVITNLIQASSSFQTAPPIPLHRKNPVKPVSRFFQIFPTDHSRNPEA